MSRHLILIIFIGLAWGQDPCDDKLLNELEMKIKSNGLEALNDREWSYYKIKAINLGLGVNPGSLLKKVEFERAMLRAEYGLYLPIDSEGDAWFSHTTFGLTYRIK